jgi:4-amino-4-deoxy-L-arabinose transferase-like glycosyltransferase
MLESPAVPAANDPKYRWLEGIALATILALAAALRLGWPGINSFSFDEARLSLMALQMAREGEFARLGMQSSTGVPNLPAAVWIFVLPYWFSADPLLVTLFVGLVGTAAVAGIWWLGRQGWGVWAGLSAALLLAASPVAVLYSRNIWSQNLLPPLAILWAVAAVVGIGRQRSWVIGLHVFLAGFIWQVHLAGIALLLATGWLAIRFALWRQWRAVVVGGALAGLMAAPYLYTIWCCGEGARADLQVVLDQPSQIDGIALVQVAEMGRGDNWEWLLLGQDWQWPAGLAGGLDAGTWLLTLLIPAGLLYLVVQVVRQWRDGRRDEAAVLVALTPLWAVCTILFLTRHKMEVYPQYQLVALPALFLAAATVASWRPFRWWGALLTLLVAAVALPQAVALGQGLNVVAERLTPGGIGTPLYWPRDAAEQIKDGRPVAIHAHGDIAEFFGDAATFSLLFWDYPHRIVDGRSALLIPALDNGGTYLLATFADLPMWSEAQAIGLTGEEIALPRREGEPPYMALRLTDAAMPASFEQVEPVTLANGAQLQGWLLRPLGDGRLRFTSWWRIVGGGTPGHYHQFNHLRDQLEGEPLAIQDMPVSSPAWQPGDTLITWVDFEEPAVPGPFWLDIGMYTWPEIERSPVLDRPGDPLAPIRLGPIP